MRPWTPWRGGPLGAESAGPSISLSGGKCGELVPVRHQHFAGSTLPRKGSSFCDLARSFDCETGGENGGIEFWLAAVRVAILLREASFFFFFFLGSLNGSAEKID